MGKFNNFENECNVKRKFCTKKCKKKRGIIFLNDSYVSYLIFKSDMQPIPTIQQAKHDKQTIARDPSSFRPNIRNKLKNNQIHFATFYFEDKILKSVVVDGKGGDTSGDNAHISGHYWYCPV